MTLRDALYSREGTRPTEDGIRRELRAWAIERSGSIYPRRRTTIVFGRSRSDALRRASAPARLGEEVHDDVTVAAEIASGWDAPVVWPFGRGAAR